MNLLGLSNSADSAALIRTSGELARTRDADQEAFASILGRKGTRPAQAEQTPEAKAREAAEQLVAITFVQPVLSQARAARSSDGPFGQTQAERQFGGMIDGMTAERMVHAARWPLVDRLARDMLKHVNTKAQDKPAATDPQTALRIDPAKGPTEDPTKGRTP